jgi:hypothetical protein
MAEHDNEITVSIQASSFSWLAEELFVKEDSDPWSLKGFRKAPAFPTLHFCSHESPPPHPLLCLYNPVYALTSFLVLLRLISPVGCCAHLIKLPFMCSGYNSMRITYIPFFCQWHPVMIHEELKESTNRHPQLKLYQFYCLLHVSASVKSHIGQLKLYFFHIAEVSPLQNFELYVFIL